MPRKLAIASVVVLLLAGTVCVLWSGLNWPLPLWIVEYGLPGSQHPTGKTITVEGVTFVMISPGYFRMGSDWLTAHPKVAEEWEESGDTRGNVTGRLGEEVGLPWGKAPKPSSEMPVHWCEFRKGFGIARTEITNSEYERFDPKHERDQEYSKNDRDPVVNVSWQDARKYCDWLSRKSGRTIRLPSESEWECACRAGAWSEYESGDGDRGLGAYAWYGKNAPNGTHEVGMKKPNPWALFDMEGNVWEWCEDRWHDSYLLTRKVTEKDGSTVTETVDRAPDDSSPWRGGGAPDRVVRGGGWVDPAVFCRSAFRDRDAPSDRYDGLGFRPALPGN